MKGEEHKQKTPPDPGATKQKTLMFESISDLTVGTTIEKDIVKAEIMWWLEVLKNKCFY